ncbi:hypothetical protein PG_0494 [Porphyromonas gingivalis W83]|uniref:Uncharacterized protein n=1 Tax=Porphyromonas gingivalis (strain ATCC BAA-308 / W83) TaxID=242619 RepID=Q7MWU3_PORGI|nr:hypothetical protein PG_0494 [Porphyromonas gingivalis W83]
MRIFLIGVSYMETFAQQAGILSIHFIVYRPIVLCVYGMINDTKRWYDKENHPTRRGFIQGRHASESIRESTECIFDPSRYAYMRGYYGLL